MEKCHLIIGNVSGNSYNVAKFTVRKKFDLESMASPVSMYRKGLEEEIQELKILKEKSREGNRKFKSQDEKRLQELLNNPKIIPYTFYDANYRNNFEGRVEETVTEDYVLVRKGDKVRLYPIVDTYRFFSKKPENVKPASSITAISESKYNKKVNSFFKGHVVEDEELNEKKHQEFKIKEKDVDTCEEEDEDEAKCSDDESLNDSSSEDEQKVKKRARNKSDLGYQFTKSGFNNEEDEDEEIMDLIEGDFDEILRQKDDDGDEEIEDLNVTKKRKSEQLVEVEGTKKLKTEDQQDLIRRKELFDKVRQQLLVHSKLELLPLLKMSGIKIIDGKFADEKDKKVFQLIASKKLVRTQLPNGRTVYSLRQ